MIISHANYKVCELITKRLENNKTGLILDSGCDGARSELTPLLLERNYKLIGIDIEYKEVLEKRNRYINSKNLVVLCADSQSPPFKSESFDIVIMVDVVEHLPYPKKAFDEAYRCLKKGGAFIVITPNRYGLWTLVSEYTFNFLKRLFMRKKYKRDTLQHVNLFSLNKISLMLKTVGFNIQLIYSPEGLGIFATIRAIFTKIKSVVYKCNIVNEPNVFYEFFYKIECGVSKFFPLWFHSQWVIVLVK